MSVKKRTYKFNWLDHLYYLGKYTAVGMGVWCNLMVALSGLPLTLLLFCLIHMLADQKYNATIMQVSIYSTCALAVIFCSKWLLKKHRFTPERERAYFRRYPQRKNYSYPFYIVIMAFMASGISGGFLIFYILKWINSSAT